MTLVILPLADVQMTVVTVPVGAPAIPLAVHPVAVVDRPGGEAQGHFKASLAVELAVPEIAAITGRAKFNPHFQRAATVFTIPVDTFLAADLRQHLGVDVPLEQQCNSEEERNFPDHSQ